MVDEIRASRNAKAQELWRKRKAISEGSKYTRLKTQNMIDLEANRLMNLPKNFDYMGYIEKNGLGKEWETINGDLTKQVHQALSDYKNGLISSKDADAIINPIMDGSLRREKMAELIKRNGGESALLRLGKIESGEYLRLNRNTAQEAEQNYLNRGKQELYNSWNNNQRYGFLNETAQKVINGAKPGKSIYVDYNTNGALEFKEFNNGKIKGLRDNAFVGIDRKTGEYRLAKGEMNDVDYNKQLLDMEQKRIQKQQEAELRKLQEMQQREQEKERTKYQQQRQQQPTVQKPSTPAAPEQFHSNTNNTTTLNSPQLQATKTSNFGRNVAIGLGGAATLGGGIYYLNRQ